MRCWVTTGAACRGVGLEFVEHRKYTAGDDYRRIDWSALARTREAFLKICHEEKQMTAIFVADLSRSMELGSSKFSKMEVLIEAVATLSFSAMSENMSVGLVAGDRRSTCIAALGRGDVRCGVFWVICWTTLLVQGEPTWSCCSGTVSSSSRVHVFSLFCRTLS